MSNLERTTSLPARMDEMRAEEEDFTPRSFRQMRRSSSMPVAEGRKRSAREFPPPLGSLARKSTSPAEMMPLSRLRSVRSNGRIVLHEVKIANQMTLHTIRHQGRLVLNLVRCKENAPPTYASEERTKPEEVTSEVVEESPEPAAAAAPVDDHRIVHEEVGKAEESKDEISQSKLRADHAHVLKEFMTAWAMKQMSCNRPVVWDHNHHFHCVTTSS